MSLETRRASGNTLSLQFTTYIPCAKSCEFGRRPAPPSEQVENSLRSRPYVGIEGRGEKKNKQTKKRGRRRRRSRRHPRDRCPSSLRRYVTESGNGRQILIPPCVSPSVEHPRRRFHPPISAGAEAVPGGANRALSQGVASGFYRGVEPALFTLASMPRLSPRRAETRHKRVGKPLWGMGTAIDGQEGPEGDDFAVGDGGSRQKSDGARTGDTYRTVTHGRAECRYRTSRPSG